MRGIIIRCISMICVLEKDSTAALAALTSTSPCKSCPHDDAN
jgi:hypothetical protein